MLLIIKRRQAGKLAFIYTMNNFTGKVAKLLFSAAVLSASSTSTSPFRFGATFKGR